MPYALRYYQEEAVNSVYDYFWANTGNPIIAMPTGTGKSLVIAELAQRILQAYPNQRIQVVTHVKTLIQQNMNKLLDQWPSAPAGIHSAGLKRREVHAPIIFGGVQSMYNRAADFGHVDLLLIDECHLVPSNGETMYQKYIKGLKQTNPRLKSVGLSATPYRLKGGHLCEGGTFTDVCFDNTRLADFNRLIDEGYLAPVRPKSTAQEIDARGLHTRAGEFIQAEVEERVAGEVTQKALEETLREGHDRQHWLVFAVSIEHAEDIAMRLNKMGVSAVCYHSKLNDQEADDNLAAFAAGRVRAIVSKDRLTTGVDLPEVDLICMLRLTRSPGLWVQMLGRGTRPAPGKIDCLALDFAGNTLRLGPINDPVLPTKKSNGAGGGTAPVKVCPHCRMYQAANARVCEYCGYEFPRFMQIAPTASTAELIKREPTPPRELHVDHVTYKRHRKKGKPDSLCVTYFCGLTKVEEFVCPGHGGYATLQAQRWWNQRSRLDCPKELDGYLQQLGHLLVPVRILVDFNEKYPALKQAFFI